MKIAVTGGAGFIGSQLVDRLVADRHEVTALVRREHVERPLRDRGAAVVFGDVRDEVAVTRALRGAEVVYHLARAKSHGGAPAAEVQSINVLGTATVADLSARIGARAMVHCSSTAVYGSRVPGRLITEDTALRPDSAYARSKAGAEALLGKHTRDGFAVVIARITAVLGPGCRSWLPLTRSIGRRRLPVIGAGTNWHHPADIAYIVEGLVLCGGTGSRSAVYNLAGPDLVSAHDLMGHIADELGVARPWSIPAAPIHWYLRLNEPLQRLVGIELPSAAGARFLTGDRRLDLTRARTELGFRPKIGVRDAIRRTVDWYRSQGLLGVSRPPPRPPERA